MIISFIIVIYFFFCNCKITASLSISELLAEQNYNIRVVVIGLSRTAFVVRNANEGLYLLPKRSLEYLHSIPYVRMYVDHRNVNDTAVPASLEVIYDDLTPTRSSALGYFPLEATRSDRWRGNQYINADGILPFQRCHSNEFYPGPEKLSSVFVHNGLS